MNTPDLLVINEQTFTEMMNGLGEQNNPTPVSNVSMYDSRNVTLVISKGVAEGVSFKRTQRRWFKLTKEGHEVPLTQERRDEERLRQNALLADQLVELLMPFAGLNGESEGAADTLRRLIREREEFKQKFDLAERELKTRRYGEETK